jgi:Tol biopolymer transport system component
MAATAMALTKGTVLGTYEILASLGAGGMGEVYSALDSKLGREVAIKILPPDYAQDPERLGRFEREARLLATLNHPNIGAIYDLAESNGTKFFVLELVPGETLADTVARGPVPVDEALVICRQIADALEAAHDRGILHRDLKPANIKITPDGKVKVLDFGLGKLFEHENPAGLSQSPTLLTGRASMEGMILGTAAYMSPEQARGKEVDRRTDIWSFGCVAFELLTGKQAFEGDTVTDLFASILRGEPDWNALPAMTPESLRLLLRRCLQKDTRRRLQHIGEARIAMEDAPASSVASPTAIPANGASRRPKSWIAYAVLSVIVIGAAAALIFFFKPVPDTRVVQFSVPPPPGGAFEQAAGVIFTVVSISPDGRRLAFTARDASGKVVLWVRLLDSLLPHSFPGTEGAAFPIWSPDSKSIAFYADGMLKKVEAAGGPPQALAEYAFVGLRGGAWNRDNVLLLPTSNNGSLSRISAAGGKPVEVTKLLPGQNTHRSPSFLPDGRHFLYFAGGNNEVSGVYVSALDSSESKRLLSADSQALYSPTGDLLFVRQGTLLRQAFNVKTLDVTGDPIPVAEHVAVNNYFASFSVSDNGVLVYKTGGSSEEVMLAWVDRSGNLIENVGTARGEYRGVDLDPDGKRIAVHRHEGNGGDVWIFETSHGPMSKLTFSALRDNSSPVWSPDGSHIAFGAQQNGKWQIFQIPALGGKEELLLDDQDRNVAPMAWSPDSKSLVLRVVDPKTQGDEYIFSFEDKKLTPLLNGPLNELWPQISPNGKWIAYTSNETGRYEIYIRPFPSGEGKHQLSVNGGFAPRWTRDGKELFFLGPGGARMASVKMNAASGTNSQPPVELFSTGYVNFPHGGGSFLPYAVSPDGQRFLIPRPERPDLSAAGDVAQTPITVIFNWAATIKR